MSLLSGLLLLTCSQELSRAHGTEPSSIQLQPLCFLLVPLLHPDTAVTFLCFAMRGLHFVLLFKLLPFLDCCLLLLADLILPMLKDPQLLQKAFPYSFTRSVFVFPLRACGNLFVSPDTSWWPINYLKGGPKSHPFSTDRGP